MALRQETEQAGRRVNRNAPTGRAHARWRALAGLLFVVAFALGGMTPAAARADDQTASNAVASAESGAKANRQPIVLDEATAVVSDTSGYHLKATVTNVSDTAYEAGSLVLTVNPMYTFVSRTDMQEWAQEDGDIPAPSEIGRASVPALQPGQSATVTIDAAADAEALTSIVTWGPKPLLVSYLHDDDAQELRTFLTRSQAGMEGEATPAMRITMVMPLTSPHWTADTQAIDDMVATAVPDEDSSDDSSATAASDAVALDRDHERFDRTMDMALSRHTGLQTVADPTYLDALAVPPQVDALMQPADFDITAYAYHADAQGYAEAGVEDADWNAQAALDGYRSALGDDTAASDVVAWQGDGQWTLAALTEAKRQGYDVVVSTHDFESDETETVHTGNVVVPTEAGDVTVLVEQRELGQLAKGKATSRKAKAERSEAGRVARFVAQSAFYQMEQPYTQRNLLVCFDDDASADTVDRFMNAVESSTWLEQADLNTLIGAEPYAAGDDATAIVPESSGIKTEDAATLAGTLATLNAGRDDIVRFRDAVLTPAEADDEDGAKARERWIARLIDAHDELALHVLSAEDPASPSQDADDATASDATAQTRIDVLAGAQRLSSALLESVSLTPSEAVTMVSETASMPITIGNHTPFPVTLRVSSITDSPELVTSRHVDVSVAPDTEEQVTLTLRAATSTSTTAHVTLQDRDGVAFGTEQTTSISCLLKISDKTGFIIIGFAVALGLLGLWRQFHRKKDPDE